MVRFYLDVKKQYKGKCDIEINGFCEYISGYAKIHTALHDGRDCTVVVRNRQIYEVLKEQEKYYTHTMSHEIFSVAQEFKNKYKIDLPEYISESDLMEDLSLEDVDFSSGEGFENAVLRKAFGTFFLGGTFPFERLAPLCKSIDLSGLNDKNRTVLRKVFQKRFKTYKEHLSGEYEKYIFNQFIDDFDSLRSDVAIYLLIKDYPKDFKEEMIGHDLCKCMDHFGVTGSYIAIDQKAEDDYCDRFKMYVGRKSVSPEELISWVSGVYEFELDQVIDAIDKNEGQIADYTDRIVLKFAPLFDRMPETKMRIINIKPPVVLENPGDDFGIEDWMKWSVENYLPFRFWLEYNNKSDENADEYATAFGDYIFEKYDELVNNYPWMMYKVLPAVKNELLDNEHTLFVILDNFNYKFLEYLTSCMNNEKFVSDGVVPVLSMIPTETAISKRAFFTAEAYNDSGDKYDKIVGNWAKNLGVDMQYLPNIGALRALGGIDKKVYFLNYLRLDEMLHEDQGSSAQRIEVRIQKEIEALVSEISKVLKKHGREKNTRVYFIADHGSTQILPSQPNGIDPKYYKDKAEESDYRFIEVGDEDYENTKAAIGSLCYALDKKRYGTENSFFIARGYNRFIKNDLKGYVHGGITPEEAIVPFARFSYDMDMCKNPEIMLVNDNLRFAVKLKLTFLVKNYNEFPVENVEIIIQNGNIKYSKPIAVSISGLETTTIDIQDARITKSMDKKNNERMIITVNYSANGRKHSYQSEIAMSIKSAQSSGTDLSDLI